ncbi:MAG: hypothetical protein LUE10_06795 [Alistipes sp.]|nr:hypothetical protein [Alistipes sp.]
MKYPYIVSKKHFAPRWIVFVIDVLLSSLALLFAIFLSASFGSYKIDWQVLAGFCCIILGIRLIGFIIFRTYSGIIRYTSTQDITRIFYCLTAGEVAIFGVNTLLYFVSPTLFTAFSFLFI